DYFCLIWHNTAWVF
nr:immunoglobulin light chain junction region [Macaca mulatta]MOX76388.1 immunoglobulin light chain junction region [Macaca mulatta]